MSKTVILTGIRANNDLHIGNYFGALLPIIDLAKKNAKQYQINLFVPDLHSFTTPIDHTKLYNQTMHNLRMFIAAGLPLDNDDIYIYRQSFIPAHSELTWILDCFTGMGEMQRMTQYKDKSLKLMSEGNLVTPPSIDQTNLIDQDKIRQNDDQRNNRISVGLFNYPVLMAADILLYGAELIPIGDDQTQHLEFTRDIAQRINNRFGEIFTIPKTVSEQHHFFGKDQGLRIKDLLDPTKKMSKSDETERGTIFLSDNPAKAVKKIMSATTDSIGVIHYDPERQPGISNLLQILALLTQQNQAEINNQWQGKTNYGELKSAVSNALNTFLTNLQSKMNAVDQEILEKKLANSEEIISKKANDTLYRVQRAIGLRK